MEEIDPVEPAILFCVRIEDARSVAKGVSTAVCSECGSGCYVSPTSFKALERGVLTVVCMRCAEAKVKQIKAEGEEVQYAMLPGTAQEIAEHLADRLFGNHAALFKRDISD